MVDKPGGVSFPFQLSGDGSNQVIPAAVAAPPGQRLMGVAMESFINLGPNISGDQILELTCPHAFAKVVDEYIKEMGIEWPSIFEGNNIYLPENPFGLLCRFPSKVLCGLLRLLIIDLQMETLVQQQAFGIWDLVPGKTVQQGLVQ